MFIVHESKQNRLKPHRGGMVAPGAVHAAPKELERIIGGTVTLGMSLLRRVGERLMSQISPRCMEILAVQGGEGGQVGIVLVIGPQGFGGGRQATGNRAGSVMRLALLAQRAGEVLQHLELLLEGERLDFTNDFCSNHGVNSLDRVRTSRIWFNMAGAQ
jgi:hypothetical protein